MLSSTPVNSRFIDELHYFKHFRSVILSYSREFIIMNTENFFKKYYGKKVRKLVTQGRSPNPCPPNRFKTIRTFLAAGGKFNRCPSKSVKSIIIVSSQLLKDNKASSLIRSISHYKYLTDLWISLDTFNGPSNEVNLFKQIRKLVHLQSFETDLGFGQVKRSLNYLTSIKSLKIIKIRFSSKEAEELESFSKLLKSKTLEFLKLEIHCASQNIFTKLLQDVSDACISAFDIFIQSSERLNLDYLSIALDHIDLLTLRHHNGPISEYSCSTITSVDVASNKARRKLTITTDPSSLTATQLDSEAHDHDHHHPLREINEIMMESFGNYSIPGLNNLKSLKRLCLNFSAVSTSSATGNLAKVIKHAPGLEHLEIEFLSVRKRPWINRQLLEPLFTDISKLTNLESLKIRNFEIHADVIDLVFYPLRFLNNLTKLKIEGDTRDCVDPYKPFPIEFAVSNQLTKIFLWVPNMSSESKKNLIKGIAKQTNLQKLNIANGLQLLAQEKIRERLEEALSGLSKLKKFYAEDNNLERNFPPEKIELDSETIVEELREFAVNVMRKNVSIEKIHLVRNETYEIKLNKY